MNRKVVYALIGIGIAILVIILLVFIIVPNAPIISNFADTNFDTSAQKTLNANVATSFNIKLAGLKKIDNVDIKPNYIVLVKDQDDKKQNGLYIASEGDWTRYPEFTGSPIFVNISEGAQFNKDVWYTTNTVKIGTDEINFSKNCGVSFKEAGYGIPIIRSKFNQYINASRDYNSPSKYIDGNGAEIKPMGREFRNLIGFIPPSIAFYPFGSTNKDYRSTANVPNTIVDDPYVKNDIGIGFFNAMLNPGSSNPDRNPGPKIEEGDSICKNFCSKTNCIALQTRVSDNCTFTKEGCGSGRSEASCSFYYKNVEDADMAYYNLYNINSKYVGAKYYERTPSPEYTPNANYSPQSSPVKWCPPEKNVYGSDYVSVNGSTCSCKPGDVNCVDPNCCKTRNLVTTANAKPMYTVPFNGATNKITNAYNSSGKKFTIVSVATTANIALSGIQTIDGITVQKFPTSTNPLNQQPIVLVKDQTNKKENGLYFVSDGNWSRCPFFDNEVEPVTFIVNDGTANKDTLWSTNKTLRVGIDDIVFIQGVSFGSLTNILNPCCGLCNGKYVSCTGEKEQEGGWFMKFDSKNEGYFWDSKQYSDHGHCRGLFGGSLTFPINDPNYYRTSTEKDARVARECYANYSKKTTTDIINLNNCACIYEYMNTNLMTIQPDCLTISKDGVIDTDINGNLKIKYDPGCFGGPPILYDNTSVSSDDLVACNDPMIQGEKCADDKLCKSFPVNCDTNSPPLLIPTYK